MLSENGWLVPKKKEGNERGSYWKGDKFISYKFGLQTLKKPGVDKRKFRLEYITDATCLKNCKAVADEANRRMDAKRAKESTDDTVQKIWAYADLLRMDTPTIEHLMDSGKIGKEKGEQSLVTAEAINSGEYRHYHVDDFGHRVYHVATNLKKNMRGALYFEGYENENLCVIDIRNSQPYLCSVIIKDPELCVRIAPEFESLLSIMKEFKVVDSGLFNYHCARGEVYTHWLLSQNILKRNVTIISEQLREKVKKEFMAFLYSAPEREGWGRNVHVIAAKDRLDAAFKKTYPGVYAFVTAIKSVPESLLPFMHVHYNRKRYEHKIAGRRVHRNYAYLNLPALMQRLESHMLRKISRRLIEAGVGPFVTVHDSWIVLESHKEITEQIIKDSFAELGVVPPQVKTEPCKKYLK